MVNRLPIVIRTIAITLLVAMVYYFAGYRLVYSIVMHSAKEDASFAIHHQGVITKMNLSATEYASVKWTEKLKEFSLNNELYDVVSIEKSGNSYILQVYSDKNETRWAKAMNDFVKCLFPAGHGKVPNHAEGLLSAFQKEYTPLDKVTVAYTPPANKVYYNDEVNCSSFLPVNPIWHPPATC